MGEYALLIKLGGAIAVVLVIGIVLWVKGVRYNALPGSKKAANNKKAKKSKRRTKSGKKNEKEQFYQQAAYVDDGDGNTEWQDSDMYAMKEGKTRKPSRIDLEDDVKDDGKTESWDDY